MAIKEHPGWKEFPLETGQAVRADQINALWWALSERGAVVNQTPIENEFAIFDIDGKFLRYRGGDRATLVKSAGESKLLAINHLNKLKTELLDILINYVDPSKSLINEAGDGLIQNRWTLSDILKDLKIGGAITVGTGGPSTTDPDFEFTIVPDRPGEVIGKDKDGNDVLFNDFFGPAQFGRIVPVDTPTFKEHLNEIYFIIKKLTHIPFSLGIGISNNGVFRRIVGKKFSRTTQISEFQTAWENDRERTITEAAADIDTFAGVGAPGVIYDFRSDDFPSSPSDDIKATHTFEINNNVSRASIPFPVFPGRIAENNDLPNPYVYGEKKIFARVTEKFTTDTVYNDQIFSASEPSFVNGILRVIIPSETVIGTADPNFINQGELVLEFDIITKNSEGIVIEELILDNIESMIPTVVFSGDPQVEVGSDVDDAISLDFNIYAGEEFGGDFTEAGPPNDISPSSLPPFGRVVREVNHGGVEGFFEITNWIHVDRERDPLPPNVPSGLESV